MSENLTYFWPGVFSIDQKGCVFVRMTGYNGDVRWTGNYKCVSHDKDYSFWKSLVLKNYGAEYFIDEDTLEQLKDNYYRKNEGLIE